METVTIAASRGFTVADMEMLVGSVVIVAAFAWMLFSKMKHLRGRHQQEPRV
jgi:ABC-type nickel/cobalt efflux system permease component RcnA